MVESSVLFPVASVSSLEENGTSVVHCDYYLIRQPKPNHRNLKELVLTVGRRDVFLFICGTATNVRFLTACADPFARVCHAAKHC